jgi:ATP-dependent DNA helicase RecG
MPARVTATIAPATTPAEFLDRPLARSGLAAGPQLQRVGRRLGWGEGGTEPTVRDLLFHLPRRYDDLRELSTLGDLRRIEDGEVVSARVEIRDLRVEPTFRRRVQRTLAGLIDETGDAEAVWFGRRFIERRLRPGDRVVISGRIKHRGWSTTFENPEFQRDDGSTLLHAGRIVPVYRLTQGLTAARLRTAIRDALDLLDGYPEYLPADIVAAESLVPIGEAIESAHYPETFERRDAALRRLAFDELIALQLGMVSRRRERVRTSAPPLAIDEATDAEVRLALESGIAARAGREVQLTDDQVDAIADVRRDLAGETPMLRLLQGDVGSGKTAVAAYAMAGLARLGWQSALLAPTDLLARQHSATIGDLLAPLGITVELLTGSLSAPGTRGAREAIASGQAPVVVGTHALLEERIRFERLGLVVVDEQHRFGVEQRAALERKGQGGAVPHVLLMTATPIPRTLGQVLYADLDVSDLRTPPSGRVPIRTGVRRRDELGGVWTKVREEAKDGHRTFVVVPLVEDGDDETGTASAASAEAEFERLRALLAPLKVGMVHGRMKPAERDAEMASFRAGELDVLVGTTVIEVGVDVPEATMMIIEDADRFGLAQLHQLRGRVGRGTAASFCVLVSDSDDEVARARLEAVRTTRDGFVLAEKDLELRQEGDVLGLSQSGLPRLRIASLARKDDQELAVAARRHAEALVGTAPAMLPGMLQAELEAGWLKRLAEAEPAGAA